MVTTSGSLGSQATPIRQALRCRTVTAGGFKQLDYVPDLPPLPIEERFGPSDDASALSAHIHADIASGNIVVPSLELDVEVDIAPNPMWDPPGNDPGPVGFEATRVAVQIEADASLEALRALVAHAVLWSPIADTLHNPVHLDVALGQTNL